MKIDSKNMRKILRRGGLYAKRYALLSIVLATTIIIGVLWLFHSHAATPYLATEPESGAVSNGARVITDSAASGGSAVAFSSGSTSGFVHPGILVSQADLDFVKAKVAANTAPWSTEFNYAKSSSYGSTSRAASPMPVLDTSSEEGTFMTDAQTAYTNALLWYYSGNTANRDQAIRYLNAYVTTLTSISYQDGSGNVVYGNGLLDAAWGGQLWPRAAEIMRYSNSGWSASDATKFETWLATVYQPMLVSGWPGGGNWQSSIAEALINIGVYTNNANLYNTGITRWRDKILPTIYSSSDGVYPVPPSGSYKRPTDPGWTASNDIAKLWWYPTSYVNGEVTETCRDLSHAAMALDGFASGAETARIQGTDLYGEFQTRMVTSMELNAEYINEYLDQVNDVANTVVATNWMPQNNWSCRWFMTNVSGNTAVQNTKNNAGGYALALGWEVGYNQYAARKGVLMPQTQKLVNRIRAHTTSVNPYRVGNFVAWSTLTHTEAP